MGNDNPAYDLELREPDEGYHIVEPKEDELFIDIDNDIQYINFLEMIELFERHIQNKIQYEIKNSKTKDHKHIYVKWSMEIESVQERIMLQAILGSDNKKEALSFLRLINGIEKPILFFEKEEE